jgi:hypothetical protein
MREVPKDICFIRRNGDSIVATEKSGPGRWEELSILEHEMPGLIESAKRAGGELP